MKGACLNKGLRIQIFGGKKNEGNSKFKYSNLKFAGVGVLFNQRLISCSLEQNNKQGTLPNEQQSYAECYNDYEGSSRRNANHFVLFEQMNLEWKGTETTYLPVFDVGID